MSRGLGDEVQKRLVARIRAIAKARGIQLTHVPDLAGVSRSHFWDVLAGRKSPTLQWLTRVAVALRCEPADLLSGGTRAPTPAPARRSTQRVPLVSAKAAAGAFTDAQEVKSSGHVDVSTRRVVKDGMFAAAVSGRSMEPLIRDGAICLFRPLEGRDPDGKVILVQLRDARDPESGGRYTVKRFKVAARKQGRITKVRLAPENREFQALVLEEDPMRQLTPIAEFLEVLVPGPA